MLPAIIKEKLDEATGVPERGTFKAVLREYITPDYNYLLGRYFMSIKSTQGGTTKLNTPLSSVDTWIKCKKLM